MEVCVMEADFWDVEWLRAMETDLDGLNARESQYLGALEKLRRKDRAEGIAQLHSLAQLEEPHPVACCLLWIYYVRIEPKADKARWAAWRTQSVGNWLRKRAAEGDEVLQACHHWLALCRPRCPAMALRAHAFRATIFDLFVPLNACVWRLLDPWIVNRRAFMTWLHRNDGALTGSALLAIVLSTELWPDADIDIQLRAPCSSDPCDDPQFHEAFRSTPLMDTALSCRARYIERNGRRLQISWHHSWQGADSYEFLQNTWTPDRGLEMRQPRNVFAREGICDVYDELLRRVIRGQDVLFAMSRVLARVRKYRERGFCVHLV